MGLPPNLIRGLPVSQAIARLQLEQRERLQVHDERARAPVRRKAPLRPEPCIEKLPESERRPMNAWERRYADELAARMLAGEVTWWAFGSYRLRLAVRTFYTPDFLVKTGHAVEAIEIKGFLEDDAAVKFKWARRDFPFFLWRMVRWERGAWKEILAK
jgi:hypothetical protein